MKMLGFAARAGKIAAGSLAVEMAVKKRKAKAVIYDEKLSENSLRRLKSLCERNGILLLEAEEGQLGKTIGKENAMVAGVLERLFSDRIRELAENTNCCTEE